MLPQVKVLCPLTDAMFGTKKVEPHHCIASLARNGSVHIYCVLHMFKGFVSHPVILEAWNVIPKAENPRSVRPGTGRGL